MGVGSTKGSRAVRWGVAKNIVMGWFITMPAAALVAAVAYWVIKLAFG
jgi:PiT family inorganic phosphate transporter